MLASDWKNTDTGQQSSETCAVWNWLLNTMDCFTSNHRPLKISQNVWNWPECSFQNVHFTTIPELGKSRKLCFFQGQMDSSEVNMLSWKTLVQLMSIMKNRSKQVDLALLCKIFKACDLDLALSSEKQMHKQAICTQKHDLTFC